MFEIIKKQIEWNGVSLSLETGHIARLANAAVVATMGETVVLCTVVGEQEATTGCDFFPLTVHYLEKFYAAGKIPGGFFKRESKPSEREVLISRLIDRSVRPLFPDGYSNAVQVICTVMSYDGVNDPDALSIIGTAAALAISEIPFSETVGAIRVGYEGGKYVFNKQKSADASLDLVIAGTRDSVLMVESEAKELPESVMLEAIMKGQEALRPVLDMIESFAREGGKQKWSFEPNKHSALEEKVSALVGADMEKAYAEPAKSVRLGLVKAAKKKAQAALVTPEISEQNISAAVEMVGQRLVRSKIINQGVRIDGRKVDEIRPITCELDILPKVHGSALFTRGETQALVITTIGTAQDEQMSEDLLGNRNDNLLLHYNFPPYAVCETNALRAPGRREVGHGKLAFKAISAVTPTKAEFPYTVRLVSEITESNGSSSMATVCGASLSMMAAGVPIKKPVAGIAMGLIKEGEKFAVLSDIMGDEDFLGDMDFKVAGTESGITALQMDIKIHGVNRAIMEQALKQAWAGMQHIAAKMAEAIKAPRAELSSNAPRVVSIQIDKDKIREVIGTGGKVIRDICEKSGAKVDIEETGKINVAGVTSESIDVALKMISDIVAVPELGKTYEGVVTRLALFGAFVKFLGSTEGLLHISEIANERIEQIEDVLKEGEKVTVQVVGIESNGKVRLSMKSLINGSFESGAYSRESSERRSKPRFGGGEGRSGAPRFGGGEGRSGAPRFGGGEGRSGAPRFGGGEGRSGSSRFGGESRGDSSGSDRPSRERSDSRDDSRRPADGGSSHFSKPGMRSGSRDRDDSGRDDKRRKRMF